MLYSDELKSFKGDLPVVVQQCITQIRTYFGLGEEILPVLEYDQHSIALPVTFIVPLPNRGTVDGIDIRSSEPILIRIFFNFYPYVAPYIVSDRKDFPRNLLPHLYETESTEPAALCVIRNSREEWFAQHTIIDLMILTGEWLFKAACGTLSVDGNEWDPIRIRSRGYHIYPYDQFHEIVRDKNAFIPDSNFSVQLCYSYKDKYQSGIGLTYRSLSPVPMAGLIELLEIINKVKAEQKEKAEVTMTFSIVVWSPNDSVDNQYCTTFPKTYGGLKSYLREREIDIDSILHSYRIAGCNLSNGIPFTLAIKRPKKMVGYDGSYEFVNFRIDGTGFTKRTLPTDAKVDLISHIEPFSKSLATKLSGESRDSKTIFVGAGALGSKMAVHDARTGKLDICIVDNDKLLQHNLVRHALYGNMPGQNKAVALISVIKDLYESDSDKGFIAKDKRLNYVFEDIKFSYDWLVDTTAGVDTLNLLSSSNVPPSLSVARAEIADEGRLGLLYVEGKDRNPRIDDLVNLTYYLAIEDSVIETWRRRDALSEKSNLSVGLGCSSTTVVMPDDVISFHASVFSKLLHKINKRDHIGDNGLIYTSIFETLELVNISSKKKFVPPFKISDCLSGSGWQIRWKAGLIERLLQLSKKISPKETGGVLIGLASYKTKTIHVFDIIEEPQDSIGTCNGFNRGIKCLPDEIDRMKEITGGVIGYIGEWHTHPMGIDILSERDKETIEELKIINRKTPIPTCAIIVTKDKVLPFVYE